MRLNKFLSGLAAVLLAGVDHREVPPRVGALDVFQQLGAVVRGVIVDDDNSISNNIQIFSFIVKFCVLLSNDNYIGYD